MLACHTWERVLKRVSAHAKMTGMNADELKYPGSRRVYVQGTLNPQVQVSMREIVQEDTVFPDGRTEKTHPCVCMIARARGGMKLFTAMKNKACPRCELSGYATEAM